MKMKLLALLVSLVFLVGCVCEPVYWAGPPPQPDPIVFVGPAPFGPPCFVPPPHHPQPQPHFQPRPQPRPAPHGGNPPPR